MHHQRLIKVIGMFSGGGSFLGIISWGAEAGGNTGGSSERFISDFNETMKSAINNSISRVKSNKSTTSLATFHSLKTTTTTTTNSVNQIDIIENLSKTKIATYHFYTMYKRYICKQFIKKISINNLIRNTITHLNPLLRTTFLPHLSNQKTYILEHMNVKNFPIFNTLRFILFSTFILYSMYSDSILL